MHKVRGKVRARNDARRHQRRHDTVGNHKVIGMMMMMMIFFIYFYITDDTTPRGNNKHTHPQFHRLCLVRFAWHFATHRFRQEMQLRLGEVNATDAGDV